jgi:cytochrome c2
MKSAALFLLVVLGAAFDARAQADPAATFARRCSACHTFGKGDLVGPDLKGVTERRTRQWLAGWISSSERTIRSGDATAAALFKKYQQQRMPEQNFSAAELASLLDYLAAGGPEADARRVRRRADAATPADIDAGRSLFVGERPLADGGIACSACHSIGDAAHLGGTLGPDLSRAYSKYQDKSLASLLARGCFPRATDVVGRTSVTDQESFTLRAFLRHAQMRQHAPGTVARDGHQ